MQFMAATKQLVFLCGARDYHAMDWYRSSKSIYPHRNTFIVTDLVAGEGFKKLLNEHDKVFFLFVLDKFLFKTQSQLGNYWRNLLKIIFFPLQVFLLIQFARKTPDSVYHAHSMYYIWLAWAARVSFVGTPQGSDILIKPYRSNIYRIVSMHALRSAKSITVDSKAMAEAVCDIAGVTAVVIQNGIDISALNKVKETMAKSSNQRKFLTSIRAFTPLYRIEQILHARNMTLQTSGKELQFIHPFYDSTYLSSVKNLLRENDKDWGRVGRDEMYKLLCNTKLAISIPSSDSSPRSVYEAIFCGAAVALCHHPFVDVLPECMKARIILVNLENQLWFSEALEAAERVIRTPYIPTKEALDTFDQKLSFEKLSTLYY